MGVPSLVLFGVHAIASVPAIACDTDVARFPAVASVLAVTSVRVDPGAPV